jgi:hypothetical protein
MTRSRIEASLTIENGQSQRFIDQSEEIESRRLHTQFTELAICDEQSAQSSQTLKSFILVPCRGILAQGSVGRLDALGIILCGLPDEVLNQVAVVLGQQKLLRELHNLPRILHQHLSIGRELVRRVAEGLGR